MASQLPTDREAAAYLRGVPVGPAIGRDLDPTDLRREQMAELPEGSVLCLATGIMGDRRRELDPSKDGDRIAYRMAAYAYRRQDQWDAREMADYWHAHLALWPRGRGRRDTIEANAFTIASARALSLSQEAAEMATGLAHDDLRDRDIRQRAQKLQTDIGRGPGGAVLVPRVMSKDDFYRRDRSLAEISVLSPRQEADCGAGGGDPYSLGTREALQRGSQATVEALRK